LFAFVIVLLDYRTVTTARSTCVTDRSAVAVTLPCLPAAVTVIPFDSFNVPFTFTVLRFVPFTAFHHRYRYRFCGWILPPFRLRSAFDYLPAFAVLLIAVGLLVVRVSLLHHRYCV